MKNENNAEEDGSISSLIDEVSTYGDSDDGYISKNDLKNIWDGIQIQLDIDSMDARLKIMDRIKQTKEWKGA